MSFTALVPTACAARVMACVVWLPPDEQVHGRFLLVFPHTTSHCSHGTPINSAATRCTSLIACVPRLPMPDCICTRPSGLMMSNPSKPTDPAEYVLIATPAPRTFEPFRCPLRAIFSCQLKISAPLSSAFL